MNKCNKVFQDSFGKKGTCVTACIASLLQIDFNEVPRFIDLVEGIEPYQEKANEFYRLIFSFLSDNGYAMARYHYYDKDGYLPFHSDENFFYIVCGTSKRGNDHAVIYNNGFPYHDPHGDDGFVSDPFVAEVIYKVIE